MRRPALDFYFEFASTYSYPAAMRIAALAQAAGVTVRWRPFLLGPLFKAQGWDTSPFNLYPAKGRYMWRDIARTCARLDLPFRRPDPFPQPSLLAARVAHVGLAADWGEAFCRAVYAAEFAEGRPIGEDAVIAGLLQSLGVAPEPTLARARSEEIKAALRAATSAAEQAGVFGAPSFVTADGELFWGHDRMAEALAWAVRAPAGRT
ncbi:MAG TPA: 2-hydroxychromene-2-carboxylate isomerase [Xanthobacteraceae bacterium]|nr:2-hydroxychromene-2-carboxylate isomerase [Xanthobacteraceae bacterium]